MPSYQNYQTEQYKTLRDMYRSVANKFADKTLFMQKENGEYRQYSYRRYAADVDALGTALLAKGLQHAHIIILGENSYEWMLAYMSVICGVGVVVPVDKASSAERLKEVCSIADATAILYADRYAESVAALDNTIVKIAFSEFGALTKEGTRLITDGDRSYVDAPLDENEMRALLFTSGTTGKSKGVMLSHRNLCFNLSEYCQMVYLDQNDTALSMLPLHHSSECTCGVLCPMSRGATIAFSEGLQNIMRNMQEVSPTVILCVSLFMETIYNKLWATIKRQGLEKRIELGIKASNLLRPERIRINTKRKIFSTIHQNFGGRLRLMISCGTAAKPDVLRGLRDFGITAIQSYGLTECAPLVAINRDVYSNDAAAGMATPNALLDIYDIQENGTGEIRYRGDNIMIGYYKMPELTAEVLRNGWLYTGDLGKLDKDGFLYVTGRKKNAIITTTGKHISPEELELTLIQNPLIRDAVVIGKFNTQKDDYDIIAILQPNIPGFVEIFGRNFPAAQVDHEMKKAISEVNASVEPFKRIQTFILRKKDFPKNTSGKIIRDPVLKEYLEG